jgi:transcriptional regulator with XRE-family HTH domain
MAEGDGPHLVDVHVGQRIRHRRKQISLSQEKLADALGLTFQQVQKYERGANRVSASMLFRTAAKLEVPVSYFFEGLEGQIDPGDLGSVDMAAMKAIQAVPETALIGELPRDQQLALGKIIAAMARR